MLPSFRFEYKEIINQKIRDLLPFQGANSQAKLAGSMPKLFHGGGGPRGREAPVLRVVLRTVKAGDTK